MSLSVYSDKMVSVIIPCWNSEIYISQTITSVLSQTYPYFELIIIDDGSTDKSADIIKSFSDQRLRYYYQENKGLPAARNKGIINSSGSLIAFLDSDDIWLPNKLEKQVQVIEHYDLIYCDYITIDENNNTIIQKNRPYFSTENISDPFLLGMNILGSGSSVLMKKKIIDSVGLFNEKLSFAEDQEYWTRIAWEKFSFHYLNEILVKIRSHKNSMQAITKIEKRYESLKLMIETFLGFNQLTKYNKGTIYNEYFFIIYSYSDNFSELFHCFIHIIRNNIKRIEWRHLLYLLKFIPRKLFRAIQLSSHLSA